MSVVARHYLNGCQNNNVKAMRQDRDTLRARSIAFAARQRNIILAVLEILPRGVYALKQTLGLGR